MKNNKKLTSCVVGLTLLLGLSTQSVSAEDLSHLENSDDTTVIGNPFDDFNGTGNGGSDVNTGGTTETGNGGSDVNTGGTTGTGNGGSDVNTGGTTETGNGGSDVNTGGTTETDKDKETNKDKDKDKDKETDEDLSDLENTDDTTIIVDPDKDKETGNTETPVEPDKELEEKEEVVTIPTETDKPNVVQIGKEDELLSLLEEEKDDNEGNNDKNLLLTSNITTAVNNEVLTKPVNTTSKEELPATNEVQNNFTAIGLASILSGALLFFKRKLGTK